MNLGNYIAAGATREVYFHPLNPEFVIKVTRSSSRIYNFNEEYIWKVYRNTEIGKWLCPVHAVYEAGKYLIMPYVEMAKEVPADFPYSQFFNDIKLTNWGIYQGRTVLIDYGDPKTIKNLKLKDG